MMLLQSIISFLLIIANCKVDPNTIKTVHVIASNHLDVGFTNLIVNVVNTYFDNYFPKVANLSTYFQSKNIPFKYLTHSWLLSLYLECPMNANLNCPSENDKKSLVNNLLLNNNTLYYHAYPFNSVNELYDKSLFEYGLYLSLNYLPSLIKKYSNNNQFNYQLPKAFSQRDVPGITRSVIPSLVKYNISLLTIGCNGYSAPPSIYKNITKQNGGSASQIFNWIDIESGQSIITMIHQGGYGGIQLRDAVLINNYDEALVFDWNSDNLGPKTSTEYENDIKQIENEFPNANVFISTLNDYMNNLLLRKDIITSLPNITSEISDTWQYGGAADPTKLQKFRVASNLRRQYLKQKKVSLNSVSFNNFSRFLLKNGEHTFGFYGIANVSKYEWNNTAIRIAINNNNSDVVENVNSWNEQRLFGIDYALEALSLSNNINESKLYNDIINEYKYIDNVIAPMNLNNSNYWINIENKTQMFRINNAYNIMFNGTTGALNYVYDLNKYINYVNNTFDIEYGYGLVYYTIRTEKDFSDWVNKYYLYNNLNCSMDTPFCKNGLQKNANPKHLNLKANLINLYQSVRDKNLFIQELDMGMYQNEVKVNYGGTSKMYMIYNFTSKEENIYVLNVDIELILINKTFTRIPENLWIIFNGNIKYDKCFVIKLNESVNINDVLLNGTQHLHAIEPNYDDSNVKCIFNENKSFVSVQGIDTGNIAFVPNDDRIQDLYSTFPVPLNISNNLQNGFGFYLVNNVWNCNYPYWWPFDLQDANSTFRFNLKFMTT